MLHHCAHWLLWKLRVACPIGSSWRRAKFDTLRLHLLKIAAMIVEKKTRGVTMLPASYPHESLFQLLFRVLAPPLSA